MKIEIEGRVVEAGCCYDESCGGETNDVTIESPIRKVRIVGLTEREVGAAAAAWAQNKTFRITIEVTP